MDDATVLLDVKPVDTSGPLAEQRLVRAMHPEDATAFLEAGGERALTAWEEEATGAAAVAPLTLAIVWHRGIDLLVQTASLDIERIALVIRLGTDLAEASQRAFAQRSSQY